ncbi:tRNA lysidine(34) synthetase TilS [Sandaracinobacter neustonicus]|uniref:tRNA(Ile)-lysidine synthase n=1 Tax=Sandaracinobacter neustonicus TaxID=1715348 RepID=A0A501XDD9_9SPHN|nr:tRNA lysidine(34) synthetase TilS [Sandaracinobacter neustonicus]TPE58459.1 tRNA lysidine(34) synthetase TilS [Sandaracinobacter neustonicus]
MGPLTADSFAAEVLRLAPESSGANLAIAVSGGPDSLALMALAADSFGPRAHVLSVDHGLRGEAAGECAMVATLAAGLGLPHATLTVSVASGGDLQARARTARYAALAGWCRARQIGVLMTAHHADDQAETLLLRLARGSGLSGLAAIRARSERDAVTLIRPLLGWRRADLAALVAARGWTPADDPSNRNPRFDRTQARAALTALPWLNPDRLAASTAHLAEAEAALAWAAARAFATRSEPRGDALLLDPDGLPAELRRRLLADGLRSFGVEADGPALARLLARLEAGGSGTLGAVQARGAGGRWTLKVAPARRLG